MALCKRRRTGVDTFLDISAAEDRDEVEVEVEHDLDFEAEEPFEITDDEDNSGIVRSVCMSISLSFDSF